MVMYGNDSLKMERDKNKRRERGEKRRAGSFFFVGASFLHPFFFAQHYGHFLQPDNCAELRKLKTDIDDDEH